MIPHLFCLHLISLISCTSRSPHLSHPQQHSQHLPSPEPPTTPVPETPTTPVPETPTTPVPETPAAPAAAYTCVYTCLHLQLLGLPCIPSSPPTGGDPKLGRARLRVSTQWDLHTLCLFSPLHTCTLGTVAKSTLCHTAGVSV